jgi:serine/threonine protein kinase
LNPGGSLQNYLDRHGRADWRLAVLLGAEVASGLAAAHARGLIHRDIKPSNILLPAAAEGAEPDTAKISDFGLACIANDARLTKSGVVPGTPMYMAPEQALNEQLDARADLFSLGSVLYTLCTGREPFSGSSAVAVLRQVCEVAAPPIRELNPEIPGWLADLVDHLHAKQPADRFTSAAELEKLLRHNLEHPHQPLLTSPRCSTNRLPRKKSPLLVAAFAIALAILVALGFLFSRSFRGNLRTGEAGLTLYLAECIGRRTSVMRPRCCMRPPGVLFN